MFGLGLFSILFGLLGFFGAVRRDLASVPLIFAATGFVGTLALTAVAIARGPAWTWKVLIAAMIAFAIGGFIGWMLMVMASIQC